MKHDLTVLDQGFVRVYEDGVYGSDLTIVNSARVSFGKRVDSISDRDRVLMRYLARHKHYSPFRHVSLQLHVCCPELVARQWYKHVVGIETTSSNPTKDHAWNEISGRYVKVDRFHRPSEFRAQSEDNKQASKGLIEDQDAALKVYDDAMIFTMVAYQKLLDLGVAKEQARMVLPMSQYTEFYWTASFQALANFLELRDHSHAQWEIRQYALAIKQIVQAEFPEAYAAWFEQE